MGGSYTTNSTTRCSGRENYGDHCTHNGPSTAVWVELVLAACIIFGFFFCYVRWAKHRSELEWIQWNDDDFTDVDYATAKPRKHDEPYYHMHPQLNHPKRNSARRGANSWISKISSRSLREELSGLSMGPSTKNIVGEEPPANYKSSHSFPPQRVPPTKGVGTTQAQTNDESATKSAAAESQSTPSNDAPGIEII